VHDFHPPIGRSGLYWVVDVPRSDLTVAPDGRSATLRLTQIEVIDQPRWPKPDAEASVGAVDRVHLEPGSDRDVSRELRHHRGRGEREVLLIVIAGPAALGGQASSAVWDIPRARLENRIERGRSVSISPRPVSM
jgi:hypothetical protein